jgi:hypothetical protein
MSNLAIRHVQARVLQHGPRGTRKMSRMDCNLLREMAALSDDKTLAQRNSADAIAHCMGVSVKSVRRSWQNLEALGEIACVRNRTGGRAYGKRRADGDLPGQAPTWEVVVPLDYIERRQVEQHAKGKTIYDHVGIHATRPPEALAKQNASKQLAIATTYPENKVDNLTTLNPIKVDNLTSLNAIKVVSLTTDLSSEKLLKSSSYSGAGALSDEEGIEGDQGDQSEPSPEATELAPAGLTGSGKGFALPGVEQSEPTLATPEPAAATVAGNEMVVAGSTEPHQQQPELHDDGAEGEAPTYLPETGPSRSTEADSIAQQIAALERTRAMMVLHFPDTSVAGERMFVDFAGQIMEVFDGATGEARRASSQCWVRPAIPTPRRCGASRCRTGSAPMSTRLHSSAACRDRSCATICVRGSRAPASTSRW